MTEGLSKRYGATLALDGLDLAVQAGEVYGYLGPERLGQDHDDPAPARAAPAERRSGRALRRRRLARRRRARTDGSPTSPASRRCGRRSRPPRRSTTSRGARRDGRRLPRRARRALPPRHRQEGPRALEGQPAEGAARGGVRQPGRSPDPRRADERARPAHGGRVPRDGARGEGARTDGLPLVAHPQRGRGALRPRRHPPRRPAGRRGDARRAAPPQRPDDRGDIRRAGAGPADARGRPRDRARARRRCAPR